MAGNDWKMANNGCRWLNNSEMAAMDRNCWKFKKNCC